MIEIVKFSPEHVAQIDEQGDTQRLSQYVTPEHADALSRFPHAYTFMADGKPVACSGVIEHWTGRGEAWALLSEGIHEHFMTIHNAACRFLKVSPYRRIEAVVDAEHINGHRWVRALGFHPETGTMQGYWPDGGSAVMYARVFD